MVKGGSKSVVEMLECREALVNTDELEAAAAGARRRVLEIRANLHRWARNDPYRQFDDVFNLVADSAFLLVAGDPVRHNKGAKTGRRGWVSAYYYRPC
jgi:RNA-directed DNA polymerase